MAHKKREFIIKAGSFHERFWNSRRKIQFVGGAFANGKTTGAVMKGLMIARDYPGSIGLIARETEKKLRGTTIVDFLKWCPESWIKAWRKGDMEVELTNGSLIHFRYVDQRTDAMTGDSTSNVLSATYDWIFVEQIDDPGIDEKDVMDLLGRLRGDTPYAGDDPTMPRTGPRWMLLTSNPTGRWPYDRLVKPMEELAKGIRSDQLIVDKDGNVLLDYFTGSTYDNAHNLEADYIATLEATYKGQQRERYLMGKWVSYEGMVYPDFDPLIHMVPHQTALDYYRKMRESRYELTFVEGYDHGLHSPSCYLVGFVDDYGNVIFLDGFYDGEAKIRDTAHKIKTLRMIYEIPIDHEIRADPDIFRRKGTSSSLIVGRSVANIFEEDESVRRFVRGNNDITNGIAKVTSYLSRVKHHRCPFTSQLDAPYIYFSDKLDFVRKEFSGYRWRAKASTGELVDEPVDKNDHAMDTIKYILGERPKLSKLPVMGFALPPDSFMWTVMPKQDKPNAHKEYRYG